MSIPLTRMKSVTVKIKEHRSWFRCVLLLQVTVCVIPYLSYIVMRIHNITLNFNHVTLSKKHTVEVTQNEQEKMLSLCPLKYPDTVWYGASAYCNTPKDCCNLINSPPHFQ